jgi:hypothetical protein
MTTVATLAQNIPVPKDWSKGENAPHPVDKLFAHTRADQKETHLSIQHILIFPFSRKKYYQEINDAPGAYDAQLNHQKIHQRTNQFVPKRILSRCNRQ